MDGSALCKEVDGFKENSATAADWQKVLAKVVRSVVSLRTTVCRAFDTESACTTTATGFVVDKGRGFILTNRHVVRPGPVVAEAMFVNREEIPVHPVYRDPVHDFGFFRYDPGAIKLLEYEEIPLAPEAASVGLEIRLVGNVSSEKVSILAGTLARLDSDAPHYKKDGYNDFNTFYMQAAFGTKGGSSGSPVIDCHGRAVALHAGFGGESSSFGASSFFLPLQRVVRALQFLQDGRSSIPRGTLQATFLHRGFDATLKLGLRSATEQMVRQASPPEETGMLVVDSAVPGGPAHKHLEPGDVLFRMNGEVTTQFLKVETLLDDSVGQKIELLIERGGISMSLNLMVQDLHSITPDHFLEVSGAVIHPLSYQQARNFGFHCGLVYVAEPGYMLYRAGVPRHAIIKKFAGKEISVLQDMITTLSKLQRGARVPLEYVSYMDRHHRKSVLVTVDRHEWYAPPQIYTRNDTDGLWTIKQAYQPLPPALPSDALGSQSLPSSGEAKTKRRRVEKDPIKVIEPTLVMLEVHVPPAVMVDGVHSQHFFGTGVIVYHSQDMGLVAVDKNTVAISASDVMLSFAAFPIEIHGEVVFLHPVHNYALVAYDPSALGPAGASVVRAAELLSEPALRQGDSVYLVGLSRSLQATSRKSIVTNPSAALNIISSADCPRYRATNMEFIELDTYFGSAFSGVLADERGRVRALWGSFSNTCFNLSLQAILGSFSTQLKSGCRTSEVYQFSRGIPAYLINQAVDKLVMGANGPPLLINGVKRTMPLFRILEVELYPTLLSKAQSYGLTERRIQALATKDPIRRQVLCVKGCLAGSKAEGLLEPGDMVLAINKEPVTCFRDVENACQELDNDGNGNDGKLNMTIFRQGRKLKILVGTDVRDGNGTTRVISWCGCLVQEPHPAVRALGFLPEEGHGVFVASWYYGSPADRYGLCPLQWIVAVNGKPTADMDAFVSATKELEHGQFVRVRTVQLNGKLRVLTLRQDLHYWPTWELRFDPDTAMWRRATIKKL